jgi:hypothetical protein
MVASQDFSGAVKVLDEAIDETRQDYTAAQFRLVQLHLNRGICNQRLHLNRKALKVRSQLLGSRRARKTALQWCCWLRGGMLFTLAAYAIV